MSFVGWSSAATSTWYTRFVALHPPATLFIGQILFLWQLQGSCFFSSSFKTLALWAPRIAFMFLTVEKLIFTVVLLKILLSGCPLGKLDWRMLKNLLPTRVVQCFENGGLNHNIFLCLLHLFFFNHLFLFKSFLFYI